MQNKQYKKNAVKSVFQILYAVKNLIYHFLAVMFGHAIELSSKYFTQRH